MGSVLIEHSGLPAVGYVRSEYDARHAPKRLGYVDPQGRLCAIVGSSPSSVVVIVFDLYGASHTFTAEGYFDQGNGPLRLLAEGESFTVKGDR